MDKQDRNINDLKQCELNIIIKMMAEGYKYNELINYFSYITENDKKYIQEKGLMARKKCLYEKVKTEIKIGDNIIVWFDELGIDNIKGYLQDISEDGIFVRFKKKKLFNQSEEIVYYKFEDIDDLDIYN